MGAHKDRTSRVENKRKDGVRVIEILNLGTF
jgi:hypothetical protein